jgi:hypothetical protein
LHWNKKVRECPVPSRDVTTKLSLGGNNDVINELFLPRGSLVSDIPAGDVKLVNLFLWCGCPSLPTVGSTGCPSLPTGAGLDWLTVATLCGITLLTVVTPGEGLY